MQCAGCKSAMRGESAELSDSIVGLNVNRPSRNVRGRVWTVDWPLRLAAVWRSNSIHPIRDSKLTF